MRSTEEAFKNEAVVAQKAKTETERDCGELFLKTNLEKTQSIEQRQKSDLEVTRLAKQIEQLNNQRENLQKQCNSTCKQEAVELNAELPEQAGKHKEEYK